MIASAGEVGVTDPDGEGDADGDGPLFDGFSLSLHPAIKAALIATTESSRSTDDKVSFLPG